jgi:hypothetical protein
MKTRVFTDRFDGVCRSRDKKTAVNTTPASPMQHTGRRKNDQNNTKNIRLRKTEKA